MKWIFYVVVPLVVLSAVIFGVADKLVSELKPQEGFGRSGKASLTANFLSSPFSPGSHSTSSVRYLTAGGATSTIIFDSHYADQIDYNIFFIASTTGTSQLVWNNQFSNATTSTINLTEWFSEDCRTNTSNTVVTHGATECFHFMTGGNATTSRNITVQGVASPHMRANFNVAGANGALWVEVVKREPNN